MRLLLLGSLIVLNLSCRKDTKNKDLALNTDINTISYDEKTGLSEEFKKYWYASDAEITSYQLQQARYGEIREGKAVLIYVTEDFDKQQQVKADYPSKNNSSVLKLNATKKFTTGVYPYSIMQSTFYPVSNDKHGLKVTSSIQEWCGHVYAQLNNRDTFKVNAFSYFQSEGDEFFELDKTILENEIWTQLRIDPESLPVGSITAIPSLEFTRLKHVPIKAYDAEANFEGDLYSINYPSLNRTLTIQFNTKFPYDIISWEESFKSGYGPNAKVMFTKATKIKQLKIPYWSKNGLKEDNLRNQLGLN